ncbi:hypothetical protein ROSEINA2194_01958 [Roseburia inulinivorans DSM 16841]|uniref:Uncharacterized protein n=1 Tax=Roseburia inulinivorans DSM 16841 TaxID=622312 RepID=C0FT90_9FIRM|nr:hypothetical protein ROSEINA2194_01958 [Roseburia inulinivorans DSM 16841]
MILHKNLEWKNSYITLYTTPQKKQKYFYGSDAINSVSLYTEYQNRKTEK